MFIEVTSTDGIVGIVSLNVNQIMFFHALPEGGTSINFSGDYLEVKELYAEVKEKIRAAVGGRPTDDFPWPDCVKPGWWIAMDKDGEWYQDSVEPRLMSHMWNWQGGKVLRVDIGALPRCSDWTKSKRQRPIKELPDGTRVE